MAFRANFWAMNRMLVGQYQTDAKVQYQYQYQYPKNQIFNTNTNTGQNTNTSIPIPGIVRLWYLQHQIYRTQFLGCKPEHFLFVPLKLGYFFFSGVWLRIKTFNSANFFRTRKMALSLSKIMKPHFKPKVKYSILDFCCEELRGSTFMWAQFKKNAVEEMEKRNVFFCH